MGMIREMSPAERKARLRLKNDFELYASKALKIRPKEGKKNILFKLNDAQRILHDVVERQIKDTGRVRVIILKGRQQGLSTYTEGRIFHETTHVPSSKAMVVTHLDKSTQTLFKMTKRFYDELPLDIRPKKKYSSKKELSFEELDSEYTLATAGGDSPGRGETLQYVHASEIAFWKPTFARDNWNGLKEAVPDEEGTMVFIESTANGIGNLFHELWTGAVNGTNEYEAVFIPWFLQKEYRKPVPGHFERTFEEQDYADKANSIYDIEMDDEQLYWRRLKVGEKGMDLFKQEYPLTAEEAFLTSGRPVFDAEKVHDLTQKAEPPKKRMALFGDKFEDDPRGELSVYEEPQDGKSYFIGADPSGGVPGPQKPNGEFENDPAVIQVLDENKEQVAVWRGYVTPDYFGEIINELGKWYNLAWVAVERNNHGGVPIYRLQHEFYYPYMYQVTSIDKTTNKETVQVGFDTNVKTRYFAIDSLRKDFRLDTIKIRDKKTLQEMATFVVTESGKMEAEEGCHDDTVMALAICNATHTGGDGDYVDPEEEWYHEAE